MRKICRALVLCMLLLAAFDTTIAGLITAAVCAVISGIRRRWYNAEIADVEAVMEGVLQEMKGDAQ